MPLALVVIAVLLALIGIKGNYAEVGAQFESDVMPTGGKGGFLQWMIGITGVAMLFRLIGMPRAGQVFIVLVILAWIMQNKNVLTALQNVSPSISGSAGDRKSVV